MKLYFIAFFISISCLLNANIFMDISASLLSVSNGTVSWADYDSDGDLDLLVTGRNDELSTVLQSILFHNDNGTFYNSGIAIPCVYQSATAWCDFDNDNDLDLVISGNTSTLDIPVSTTLFYENQAGVLVLSDINLIPISNGSLSWIDVDKDGYKDLFMTGNASSTSTPSPISVLYHNDHGVLVETDTDFTGVYESAAAVFDYNSDGFDDILVSGNSGNDQVPSSVTHIYKDNNGTFEDVLTALPDIRFPALDWADYDHDGDPDLILAGYSDILGESITAIFANNLGNFTSLASDFYPVSPASISWGDFDIDGDMDLLFTGNSLIGGLQEPITTVYRNDDSLFIYTYDAPVPVINGMAAFGDFDSDHDLDIALTGEHPTCPGGPITRIYRNDIETVNETPSIPTGLNAHFNDTIAFFSWNPSTDIETNQVSLTYNLRIGITPGGNEVLPGMANPVTGKSLLPQRGNTRYVLSRKIPNLTDGTYYWSVQAIDNSYASSPFAEEQTLIVNSTSNNDVTAPNISVSVYPNPFHETATFSTKDKIAGIDKVMIYNIRGQVIREFVTSMNTSSTSITWDGKDSQSIRCCNGIYFYSIFSRKETKTGKILYIK